MRSGERREERGEDGILIWGFAGVLLILQNEAVSLKFDGFLRSGSLLSYKWS